MHRSKCCAKVPQDDFVEECAFDACAQCEQDKASVKECMEKVHALDTCRTACAANNDFDRDVLVPSSKPRTIARNKRVGYFAPSDNYEVTFSLRLTSLPGGWRSVVHIGNGNIVRYPGVWSNGDRLYIMSASSRNRDRYVCTTARGKQPQLKRNDWVTVKYGAYEDGSVRYYFDGELVCKSKDWKLFPKMPVYVADPWYAAAPGQVRDLVLTRWSTGRPGSAKEKKLSCKGKRVAKVSKGYRCGSMTTFNNYDIEMEIRITGRERATSNVLYVGRRVNYGLPELRLDGNTLNLRAYTMRAGSRVQISPAPGQSTVRFSQNRWTKLLVRFVKEDDGVKYAKVYVDGVLLNRYRNIDYQTVYDEPVFLSSPFQAAAKAEVRNLRYYTYKSLDESTICGMAPPAFYAACSAVSLCVVAVLVYASWRRTSKRVVQTDAASKEVAYGTA